MNCCLLSQEVRKILENIENLQAQDFMEKQLYEELFSVKSKIDRSEIKFKLMDRAKSVKAKHIAEEFIKEFQKAEQEKEKEEKANRSMQLVENITNFYPDSVDKEYPKSEDCKRKMLAALEEHLDELTTEMSDMSKDAECREERDLVKRYVEKLRDML